MKDFRKRGQDINKINMLEKQRRITMRHGEKGMSALSGENQLFGVDFQDLIQKGQNTHMVELACELGLTSQDAKKLKKQIERN